MNISGSLERIQQSFEYGLNEQRARELAGVQPALPFTDFEFIATSNIFYFTMTYLLYSYMQRQEKGYDLKGIIFYYNLLCVALAGAVVVGIAWHWLKYGLHSFVCNQEDRGKKGHELAYVFYLFYAQKFVEWLDTWFFILRRSFRQVTFLHIFHHSSITVVVGMILPQAFSGDMYLPILLNALVHCIMYSYYALTSIGYRFWWKKYLTSLQLIQFVLISTQSLLAWRRGPHCGTPDFAKALLIAYMGSMLYLFGQFFIRSYHSEPKSSTGTKKTN